VVGTNLLGTMYGTNVALRGMRTGARSNTASANGSSVTLASRFYNLLQTGLKEVLA